MVCGTLRPSVLCIIQRTGERTADYENFAVRPPGKKNVTFACDRRPRGHQAFLSTKFGLPLVEDDEAAACVVDELRLDPDEDTEAGA
jgi:hypothetical protein